MNELAKKVVDKLIANKITVGSVESMTAGLFGATFCEIPGASSSYMGGLITYDPKEKTRLADVKKETIDKYGVVSKEVAFAMALGGRKALDVDLCISVTGNAGPSAQEGGAKVGDFYIGLNYLGSSFYWFKHLEGERNEIRRAAVQEMFKAIDETISQK